ncbi:TetR family transcriptional regulator [Rhizobium sp. YS-1r]|jgi:AcrR family transcriptional regulator|uniref:TetR family transcriptional regulator n=1 Tax=Rhizobium sp. YS-1r TaxID=1532558 RepID=UPI00050F4BEE|nr:TetR family transcriptional regulator [Rhizobium sp. YS-1r]KGE00910.1 TetR family transcriptional regulator [Rhizobium sp. YS-1r]
MHGRANLTAMRLMDACEHLLCEAEALEDLTARRIAIEANATPSAIAYHFGSQEELVAAVAERVYRRLNAERLRLLQKAIDRRAPDPPNLEEVIAALVGPSIRWSLDPTSSYPVLSHFTSMAKTHREQAPHYRRIIDNVEHHRAFIPHLKRIAPWLDEVDIGWRLNCALGIRSQVTRSRSRTEVLTNYRMNLDDPEIVITRMVEVIAPMFRRIA